MHTNDLHSHFRGEKTPLGLGGVARIKTAVTRIRASVPHSLLVDGGDWSEGNIYYNEGAGRETLRMMDHLGYDVAVVGNHDWLNGVETLLGALEQADPALTLVASNVKTADYAREREFQRRIPPYVIRQVGGAKVAFIGLVTYEFIYDRFFKPVKILEPFRLTRELARELKNNQGVDAVIAISHNSIALNKAVLKAAPEVDLLVGAHDHRKLVKPVVVERFGAKPAWIVETGSWGRYLGRVDLRITPRDPGVGGSKPSVELLDYRLLQMDATIPEDPETLGRIATLEALIESKRGPIFHDHVGDSEIELSRSGMENLMGDFATDAYRDAVGADLSIDHTNFIYNEIHRGTVTTADVFNANPGVYDPRKDKAWTLRVLPIRGRALSWMLNLLYSAKAFSQGGSLNYSGVEMVFNPALGFARKQLAFAPALDGPESSPPSASGLAIKSFKINGEELDSNRTYRLAAPGGLVEALEFLDSVLPNTIPLQDMVDTGQEGWRIMAARLRALSPLKPEHVPYGRRIRTVQADLGMLEGDIGWSPSGRDAEGRMLARVTVRIRNTGTQESPAGTGTEGPLAELLLNENGVNYAVEPRLRAAGRAQAIPSLAPGATHELSWEGIAIPETLGLYAITARISGSPAETNLSNNEVTRHFTSDRR